MFSPAQNLKVFIAMGTTDMRKAIDGLSILVSEKFNLDPFSGHLFVFCNHKQNIVKFCTGTKTDSASGAPFVWWQFSDTIFVFFVCPSPVFEEISPDLKLAMLSCHQKLRHN